MTTPSDTEEEISEFTDEEDSLFRELLSVGAVRKIFRVAGHRVEMRTLTVGEHIEVGRILRDFESTYGFQTALQTAVLAAAIISIDDEPLVSKLSTKDKEPSVERKFQELCDNYYPPMINKLYEKFDEMEKEQLPLLEKLKKA